MTALIVLASIVAYFVVGYLLAVRDMPDLWARARKSWSTEDTQRSSVHMASAMTFLFWPFRWPFVLLFNTADRVDPQRLQEEVEERDRKIADLERQLRIGGSR
jgi:hypothetical protein